VIDEGSKPVARGVIVNRSVGNVFMTLLRPRQFHTMRASNKPPVHHGVRYLRMELERIASAETESLDRKGVAFRQEFTA
jgi:hypothetical protein